MGTGTSVRVNAKHPWVYPHVGTPTGTMILMLSRWYTSTLGQDVRHVHADSCQADTIAGVWVACGHVGMQMYCLQSADADSEGCGWWVRLGADVLCAVWCGCRWWSTQVRVKKKGRKRERNLLGTDGGCDCMRTCVACARAVVADKDTKKRKETHQVRMVDAIACGLSRIDWFSLGPNRGF